MVMEEERPTPAAIQATESATAEQPASRRLESYAVVFLLFILLVGAYFRFTGLNWDDGTHLHPDERFLTGVAAALQPVSDPLAYLRTSESTLNPYNAGFGFYVYGNLPMTVTRYVAEWVSQLCNGFEGVCTRAYSGYDGVHLVGRALSGLIDLVAVAFTFLIGRRLYDWRAGLLAALLLALAVLPIQQSHFFTMDNWSAAFATVAMYFAVRASEDARRKRWWLLFGLFLGFAVASRINVALLALMAVVASIIWLARRSAGQSTVDYVASPGGNRDLQTIVIGLLIAGLASIITFRLAQPYAFADSALAAETAAAAGENPSVLLQALQASVGLNPQWVSNMVEIQGQQSPEASFPPALQWTDRTAIVFPWTNMVLYGMGLAAGLMAWFGFFWAAWRILRARPDWYAHLLPVAWVTLYFLFTATRWVKSMRYLLPVYPILLLLAGWAMVELWKRAGEHRTRRAAVAGLTGLVLLSTLLWANAFVEIYRQPLTRVAASRWMYENVPTAATLVYQVDGETRELQLPSKGFTLTPGATPGTFLYFETPADAQLLGVRLNYLTDPVGGADSEQLRVTLLDATGEPVASGLAEGVLSEDERSLFVEMDRATLMGGESVSLNISLEAGDAVQADTSRIVNEHWDDLLPVNIDGKNSYGSYYTEVTGGQRPITWPDTNEEKRQAMYDWIDEADYIALSSQRALWSTPRLPLTYPLNVRYYEALFNGELGFELIGQFHGDINIGPLYISDTGGKIGWGGLPQIGWPPPGDLAAEEAFSVYDHPPVWIFRKTEAYDPAAVRDLLGSVDLSETVVMNPGQATSAPNGLLLTPEARALQQANGTFDSLFNPDSLLARNSAVATLIWWLAVVLFGWLTFPLAFAVFRGFPGRGYALSRMLGILLVSYFGWLAASLGWLANSRGTLALGVLLLLLTSVLLYFKQRQAINDWLRQNLAYIAFVELFAVAFFLLALIIRLGNPDVWDVIWGGEKPMDLSYFNAVLKSTTFPPYDPWFAGGYINYYYYGFVFAGVLTKLLAIPPAVAYNLILPMLFSFTALGAFSIAYNLAMIQNLRRGRPEPGAEALGEALPLGKKLRRALPRGPIVAGVAAAAFCVLLGNLAEVGLLLESWQRTSDLVIGNGVGALNALARTVDGAFKVMLAGHTPPIGTGDWFWTASRAINANPGEAAPITEFPFFTFLYGDLHAHMISLPLTLLALAWSVSLVLGTARFRALPALKGWHFGLVFVTGGIAIGVLRATNTWDWPTYLFIGCLAVTYAVIARARRFDRHVAGEALLQVLLLIALSTITFWPYIRDYGAGYESISLWGGSYTYLANYLVIFGLFLFIVITHLGREFRAWTAEWTMSDLVGWRRFSRLVMVSLILYVLLLIVFVLRGYWILPVALTLTIAAGLLGLRAGLPVERRVVLILISSALGLTALVEVVVLDGDVGRMNTVFKFYMQVWTMLSIAGGVALVWAWPAVSHEWGRGKRRVWQAALVLLLVSAALYPLLATRAKWQVRMTQEAPNSLDGMAFMQYASYGDTAADGSPRTIPLRHEYDALRWMQDSIKGSPVIVEAHSGNPYRSIAGRVAMYTGLPTVIGWDWHQRQQRATVPDTLVWNRVNDVRALFDTADIEQALRILNKYGVQYVYVGELERTYYLPAGIDKFEQMVALGHLQKVYENEGVSIYQVLKQG